MKEGEQSLSEDASGDADNDNNMAEECANNDVAIGDNQSSAVCLSAVDEKLSSKSHSTSKGGDEGNEEEDEVCMTVEQVMETLDEMFTAEEEAQHEAERLLGGCLDLVCTYPEGYKFRQPLYACKTCFDITGKMAGICYACADNCHEGHEMFELYTKRHFCCDCGNSKFNSKCSLYEEKDPVNKRNKYNDNFKGIFCVCKKPYPPNEGDIDAAEEMMQCCLCEDWFHPSHIFSPDQKTPDATDGDSVKIPDDIEGLICKDCVAKHPFLTLYPNGREQNQQQEANNAADNNTHNECKLESLKNAATLRDNNGSDKQPEARSMWAWYGWRDQLCKCRKCMDLYEDLDCAFLVDHEDTIMFYEQQGRERAAEQQQKREQLAKPKDKQMAEEEIKQKEMNLFMAKGIEEMKTHIADFLKGCGKRTITRTDVDQCFEELRAKRRKMMEQYMEGEEKPTGGAWTQ